MADIKKLEQISKLVRLDILKMTTEAGSGHLTSSLSAVEIMVDLFFAHLRFNLKDVENPGNDRVIFSKGHASPLFFALYAAAGVIDDKELLTYRKFESKLEGHPTPRFRYAEVATGSLGQGLSIGLGMALANDLKLAGSAPYVYVLLGDSEIAEGSVWEAVEIAAYYKVSNLVAIVDVNRLGQSRETMLGWNLDAYKARFEAFGWQVYDVDGYDFGVLDEVFESVKKEGGEKPKVILAKTAKGHGISFLEDKEGWHGKALSQEEFEKAVVELGEVDENVRGEIKSPEGVFAEDKPTVTNVKYDLKYKIGDDVATRKAYGEALVQLAQQDSRVIALDGEVSNSTFSEMVGEKLPNQYLEMFIAEQNMVGVALGLSKRGYLPFVSTFATFFTRAFDQIRMCAYSQGNVKFVGSHGGVSIGEDGPSQMGLEDLAMFKTVFGSRVLCPSDAVSCARLVDEAAGELGIVYIRTARPATPVIYSVDEEFKIGGSKVLKQGEDDKLTIVACGVVVHEALGAYEKLKKEGISVRVIDAYSIKPIDQEGILKSAQEAGSIVITVEDHYFDGGLGDSVLNALSNFPVWVVKMAVSKLPMSGKPAELIEYEGIDVDSIVKRVKDVLKQSKVNSS